MSRYSYRVRHVPQHPKASATGCVCEHVLVAEAALGKCLPYGSEVHHVDGDTRNNGNRNLVICQDRAYHKLLHVRARILLAGGNPNTQALCSGCGQCRDFAEFNKCTANKSAGVQRYCRDCGKHADAEKRALRKAS